MSQVRGIARDGVVEIVAHAQRVQPFEEGVGGTLPGLLRHDDLNDESLEGTVFENSARSITESVVF